MKNKKAQIRFWIFETFGLIINFRWIILIALIFIFGIYFGFKLDELFSLIFGGS